MTSTSIALWESLQEVSASYHPYSIFQMAVSFLVYPAPFCCSCAAEKNLMLGHIVEFFSHHFILTDTIHLLPCPCTAFSQASRSIRFGDVTEAKRSLGTRQIPLQVKHLQRFTHKCVKMYIEKPSIS